MNDFWTQFPTTQQKLLATHQYINQKLKVRNKDIAKTLADLTNSGGKMLRPGFFFLFAQMGDTTKQNEQQLIKIAASLEILHMATLIHDDVIDDSPLRRGQITIQALYGKDIAVYTGDLLFTEFFDLLADTMNASPFFKINAKAMKKLLLGELDQMHTRYKKDMTVLDYLRSINGKTAELFSLSCLEGAYFGHASVEIQRLAARIGRNIGLAFQIYDDILDYSAKKEILKKPVLEDLSQGIYTLPLILAKQKQPEAFDPYLDKKATISLQETVQIAQLVHTFGGVKEAKKLAKKSTEKALTDIHSLPDTKEKKQLKKLTQQLLKRAF